VIIALAGLAACSSDDGPTDLREKYNLRPFGYGDIPYPADNGPADEGYAERVALGRLLFFDHLLAGDLDTSCGTCHHPAFAWADARPLGAGVTGVGLGPDRILDSDDPHITDMPRNVPTNLNAGLSSARAGGPPDADGIMFWDSRESSLEVQALQPTATFDEMRHYAYSDSAAADSIKMRLRQVGSYEPLFRDAFPDYGREMDEDPGSPDKHVIRVGSIEMALSAYQRELVTLSSPYDDYVAGDDKALSAAQLRGLDLFFGRARCGSCHNGPMLSDYSMSRYRSPAGAPGTTSAWPSTPIRDRTITGSAPRDCATSNSPGPGSATAPPCPCARPWSSSSTVDASPRATYRAPTSNGCSTTVRGLPWTSSTTAASSI
jgi:cytochrome c peroxidase